MRNYIENWKGDKITKVQGYAAQWGVKNLKKN